MNEVNKIIPVLLLPMKKKSGGSLTLKKARPENAVAQMNLHSKSCMNSSQNDGVHHQHMA